MRVDLVCVHTTAFSTLITAHRGSEGCETLRLPHFLNNRLSDGGKVSSHMCWPPFTPSMIPSARFC
jgi:hypothetical protein